MIKEDVRMKKWAPRVLLAAALAGLSCISVKGRCMDILDLVAVGISDGNGCHACDRETVCRI